MQTPSHLAKAAAALVHLYTASGAVLAFLFTLAAVTGDAVLALWIGLVAMIVDSTDGALARWLRVKEVVPWFDGGRLDDIVDYLTYVFAPVMLLWAGGFLAQDVGGLVLASLPLLASCYQFCRVDAKTEDHFFLGFPSYWNVVAFYVVVLNLPPVVVGLILAVCSALVFVPIRYIYPSRTRDFRRLTLALSALWMLCYALILLRIEAPNPLVVAASLLYLCYYVAVSLYLTYRSARRRAAEQA